MTTSAHHQRLTAKQEYFCEKVLDGLNLSDAYRAAYNAGSMKPETVNRAAKALADNPKIAARLGEFRGAVAAAAVEAAAHTLDDAMNEAGDLLEEAKTRGQISAGVAAAKLRAHLAGLLTEKRDSGAAPLDGLDVERLLELRAVVEERIKQNKEALAGANAAAAVRVQPLVPVRRVI